MRTVNYVHQTAVTILEYVWFVGCFDNDKWREIDFGLHFMLLHLGADLGKHKRASSS